MTKPKVPDCMRCSNAEHRKKFQQEYAETHKDEIAQRKRGYWIKKKHSSEANRCLTCGDPVPHARHYSHYCCRECYLQAFEVYREKTLEVI